MRAPTAIYPPLLAAFPVLSLYASNQSLIPLRDLWRPLFVVVGVTTVLWLVLGLALRRAERGAIAATVLAVGALSLHLVVGIMPFPRDSLASLIGSGTLIFVLAALAVWKWQWHRPLSFFACVLVAIPTFQIASAQMGKGRALAGPMVGGQAAKDYPDIVYIILDGYGRTDVFERLYGFSDQGFIEGLEKRGFYVAKKARANYCQTELSLSSSLNYDYIQDLKSIQPVDEGRPNFAMALENSRTMTRLKEAGYQTSAITTGFPSLQFMNVDRKEVTPEGVNLLESTILQRLPSLEQTAVIRTMFEMRQQILRDAFERLSTLSDQGAVPQFTIVHILAPHPPFSFGPNGENLPKKGPYGYWDGSDYMEMVADKKAYREGYAGQATFIGKKILESLDKILAGPGPRPIIVIQGDHGPKMGLDQSELEKTNVGECFPILNAYLVPDSVREELYPEITPVNSFRTVFRRLLGDDLPNLEDRSWYSPYGRPLEFTEVTERIE